jgi:hypothetical protein
MDKDPHEVCLELARLFVLVVEHQISLAEIRTISITQDAGAYLTCVRNEILDEMQKQEENP